MNERYSRQILFSGIGSEGQRRLGDARVLIVGCGALGSGQAESLARAGVGQLRIADRDFVESSNLQRQTMFTEDDAAERLPKAIACANHIGKINSEITVEPEVSDVNHSNIERLIEGCDVVLDGTDNFATRCLRCVFEEAPPPASAPTCDTAGVIMPIINFVAAVQVTEALKLLTHDLGSLHQSLMQFDVWRNEWRRIGLRDPSPDCLTCAQRRFETLTAESDEFAAVLCGRNAVQISPSVAGHVDLASLSDRLKLSGEVKANEYLLRFSTGNYELTVFADARSIIRGTSDVATARSLYSKYVGN